MIIKIFLIIATMCGLSSCLPAVVAGTAAGVKIATDDRKFGTMFDDTTVSAAIHHGLIAEDAHLFTKINIDVKNNIVLLTGFVGDDFQKQKAEDIAWQQKGVNEVINEIIVENIGTSIKDFANDSMITSQVKAKMFVNLSTHINNASVRTIRGTVYLLGSARNNQELDEAIKICSSTPFVKKVISHIRIMGDNRPKTIPGKMHDGANSNNIYD